MCADFQVGLLCLVGLSVCYPAQPNEGPFERRNLRKKNVVSGPREDFRSRQSEPLQPEYLTSKPKKTSQYTPLGPSVLDRESSTQESFVRPVLTQKRKPSSPVRPAAEKYVAEASNTYGDSGYDESHLKFEQGVQNSAASYNSDQVSCIRWHNFVERGN